MDFTRGLRKSMRFPLQAPVVFWWRDENDAYQQSEGWSRDISERGAFVFAVACPPVGADVGLRISFAALPEAPRAQRMEVEGRVLRVEQPRTGKGSSGFAVLSNEVILRENDESTEEANSGGNEGKAD